MWVVLAKFSRLPAAERLQNSRRVHVLWRLPDSTSGEVRELKLWFSFEADAEADRRYTECNTRQLMSVRSDNEISVTVEPGS